MLLVLDRPPVLPTQNIQIRVEDQSLAPITAVVKSKLSLQESSTPIKPEFKRIINEIKSYRELSVGWDGDDSLPVSGDVISNALQFVSILGPFLELIDEDYIYPTPSDSIVIDFQNNVKDLASIEIGKTSIGFFLQTEGHVDYYDSEDFFGFQVLPPKVAKAIRRVWERRHNTNTMAN